MKNKYVYEIYLFIYLFLNSGSVWSAELFEYAQSIRALGMGNAYTAVVNDGDALFYNPAALGRVKGINLTVFNLNTGINGENALQSAQTIADSSATGIDRFADYFGQRIWLGLGGKINLYMPHFGIAVYDSGSMGFELKNPILPYFDINYLNDYGLVVGGSFTIAPSAYLGFTAKKITRMGTREQIGISSFLDGQTTNIESSFNRRGNGYGADLGIVWEIPAPFNPVISGVWKDVGGTTFLKEAGIQKPPNIAEEKILGVAAGFDLKVFALTAAIDYKHIETPKEPLGKKLHMGLELDLPLIDVRGGFSQGYYTLGASLDFFLFQLDVAYYGVEIGEYPGQDEDRRIQFAMTMDLGFDPSFKFIDFNKVKGRKVKQRR